MHLQQIVLTIIVSAIGGLLLSKFKVPGGLLIGSIVFAAVYNVITGDAYMTLSIKAFAQTITGAYIGSLATREDLAHLPKVIKPLALVMLAFLFVNLLSGFLIYFLSPMDLCSALLSTMPGGVSDTVLIALDMGADVTKVAVMQLVRLFFGIGMLPIIVKLTDTVVTKRSQADESVSETDSATAIKPKQKESPAHWAITVALIAASGILGKLVGIPAGVMLFSMVTMILIRMKLYESIEPPKIIRVSAQILIGACVGAQVTRNEINELPYIILPIVIMVTLYIAACLLMGFLLHKKFGMDLREGMLCQSPAGATEMALIAADMGIDSTSLVVIQIARLIVVMAIFPQIISLICSFV